MLKVGMVGLGGMGKAIAINIAKAGFEFTVADLREAPLKELQELGASVAGNPREVAAAADIVLASLPSNAASEQVALGPDGVLAGAKSGDIYIELNTISLEVVRNIADRAAEQGVSVLDAPVSGDLEQRQKGKLSIMAGGDTATLDRAMPVLKAFGDKIFHAGESGAGATVKLVNNLLCGINMVATMEALVLGVKGGLSVQTMKEVISASSGSSRVFDRLVDTLITLSPEPPPGKTADMGLHTIGKDVKLAVELAQNLSVPLVLGSSALQPFLAGLGNGWADKENWVIMEIFEQMSGVRVRPPELWTREARDEQT
jgi:2-hydroxymethylglutarate dehydrogenase